MPKLSKFFLLLTLLISLPAFAQPVEYFTDNGYGNPVSTMHHPCAEFVDGITYLTYQGPHEDPYVCTYNHTTQKWTGPFKAGVNPMGREQDAIDQDGRVDNHGRPAMIVDAKGYIHIIFGGHGGSPDLGVNQNGTPGRGKQTHAISKRPHDITEWETLENISPFGTYSQFVKMDNGDLYLFFRHGSHRSNWVYQKSIDHGRTFADPTPLLISKPQPQDPDILDAWYAWFAKGKSNTITASYVYHPCGKGDRHTKDRHNTYYMQLNTDDNTWHNAPGQHLTIPILKEYADKNTLIFNTQGGRANHGTCRVDENGNPHIFFRHEKGHARYYRWLGDKWQQPVTIFPGNRSQDGDMIVHSPTHVQVLLRYNTPTGSHVGYFTTTDGGLTWKKEKPIVSSNTVQYNPISAIARNAHPDARLLIAEDVKGQQHQYHHMILLGDNGPVTRPLEETKNLGNRMERIRKATTK
ncbi:MAG: hypothetical protein ACI8V2_003602 [Candidatus Latescibacterota bacterium]|jgi:hypothetical protein